VGDADPEQAAGPAAIRGSVHPLGDVLQAGSAVSTSALPASVATLRVVRANSGWRPLLDQAHR
jgi:hypothetical protein